jgi:hypothetical protein
MATSQKNSKFKIKSWISCELVPSYIQIKDETGDYLPVLLPSPLPKTLEFDLGSIQTLGEIDNLPSVRLETSPLLAPVKAFKFFTSTQQQQSCAKNKIK